MSGTPSRDEWVKQYDETWAESVATQGKPRPITTEDVDRGCAFLRECRWCGFVTFWPGFANGQWYRDREAADNADPECRTMFRIQYNGWGDGSKEQSHRRYVLHSIVAARPGPRAGSEDGPITAATDDYWSGWLRLTDDVRNEIIRTLLDDTEQVDERTVAA